MTFQAILINDAGDTARVRLADIDDGMLPEGTGKVPVVRKFPMISGIGFAGFVLQSRHVRFRAGDAVLLNGFGAGDALEISA